MRGVARGFFTAAIVYGLIGLLLGLHMAIGHDHGQRPTHAHIMVIGWVSFAIFGLFYYLLENSVPRLLSLIHFWLAQLSMAGLAIGLWLVYAGHVQYELVPALSAIGYALSFAVFAATALLAMRKPSLPSSGHGRRRYSGRTTNC